MTTAFYLSFYTVNNTLMNLDACKTLLSSRIHGDDFGKSILFKEYAHVIREKLKFIFYFVWVDY